MPAVSLTLPIRKPKLEKGEEIGSRPKTSEKEVGVAADQEGHAFLIFHVAHCASVSAPAPQNEIQELLDTSPRVRRFAEVYRTLATLLKRTPDGSGFAHQPTAVIAAVDDWHADEFEFFRLLRAARPQLTILAYSILADEARIDRALRAGAAGRATATEINLLLTLESPPQPAPTTKGAFDVPTASQPPTRTAPTETVPPVPQPVTAPVPAPAPVDSRSDDEPVANDDLSAFGAEDESVTIEDSRDEPPIEEDDVQEALNADDTETPARVPWLRYNDQPLRMNPGARVPPAAPPRPPPENGTAHPERHSAKPVAPSTARPAGPPPLLSDEELRALLEDDVSALAPSEESPRQREPRSQGS